MKDRLPASPSANSHLHGMDSIRGSIGKAYIELLWVLTSCIQSVMSCLRCPKPLAAAAANRGRSPPQTNQALRMANWLVVSTHLKNISQIRSFPQVGVKIKNIWNHHLAKRCHSGPNPTPSVDFFCPRPSNIKESRCNHSKAPAARDQRCS